MEKSQKHTKKRQYIEYGETSSDDEDDDREKTEVFSIDNEIHFNAPVNNDTINKLIKEFNFLSFGKRSISLYCNEKSCNEIYLFITSCGGALDATFRFIDYIENLKKQKRLERLITVLTGTCASAATIIGQLGDVRLMTTHSFALIHELNSYNHGNYTSISSHMKMLNKLYENVIAIFAKRTSLSKQKIKSLFMKDTWLSAQEYLKLGFVDDIFGEKVKEESEENGKEEIASYLMEKLEEKIKEDGEKEKNMPRRSSRKRLKS